MRESRFPNLEIIFKEPLCRMMDGFSQGSAIFPLRVLVGYNLETNSIILRSEYCAFQNLQNGDLFFESPAPRMPQMTVNKDMVVKIREIDTDRIIYPV